MSAPRFTPGPWSVEAGRSIVTPSGRFYLGYGTHPKSGNPGFRNFVELDNNAYLCAAAPELYAALKRMVREYGVEHDGLTLPCLGMSEPGSCSICDARHALGKAVGK